jgi:hypothetical protein
MWQSSLTQFTGPLGKIVAIGCQRVPGFPSWVDVEYRLTDQFGLLQYVLDQQEIRIFSPGRSLV